MIEMGRVAIIRHLVSSEKQSIRQELTYLPTVTWYQQDTRLTTLRLANARQAVLTQMSEVAASREWVPVADLLAALQKSHGDFLVPPCGKQGYRGAARYSIYNNNVGWSFDMLLSDEDGWLRVETGFVYLVLDALRGFGLLDDSGPARGAPTAIRLTPLGRHVLRDGPVPHFPAVEGARIVLQPNFHLVAFGPVPEVDLLEMERFAERLSADRAVEFNLTRESVYRAQQTGMGAVRRLLAELGVTVG